MCTMCIYTASYVSVKIVIYNFIYHSKNVTYFFGNQNIIRIFVVQK